MTHRLIPSATLGVPVSSVDDYAHCGLETVGTPDDLLGISRLRNWILHQFTEDCIVMWDDDVIDCVRLMSMCVSKLTTQEILYMIEQTAWCAQGAGAALFGWNQRPSPMNIQRNKPFGVNHWVGGVIGVLGREPRWDETLRAKCDIDCCLRELLHRRLVFTDSRYSFQQHRDTNNGGCSTFRTKATIDAEKAYLKKKWRSHLMFDNPKAKFGRAYLNQETLVLNVTRRQQGLKDWSPDESDDVNAARRYPRRTGKTEGHLPR